MLQISQQEQLLLLLLSHFSRVRLCATPQTAAHQAPPSLGFSRQEHWSGLPFPSPMRESEVAQSCPTLSDPMDCSPPGSSFHGIFQARGLEWGAIAFPTTRTEFILNVIVEFLFQFIGLEAACQCRGHSLSPGQEDTACHRAPKPVHNPWGPCALEPTLCSKRRH